MTFNGVLAEAFARHATAQALLTQDGQILTFERLERTVAVFATRLRDEGVGPGQCIAILTDNNAVRIGLFLALARLGPDIALIQAPAPLAACGQKIDAVIRFPDQGSGGVDRSILFGQDWLSGSADPALRHREPGRMILSTSGSTGAPRYIKLRPQVYVDIEPSLADGSGASLGPVMSSIPVTAPFSIYLMVRAFRNGHGFSGMKPTGAETLKEAARFGVREMMLTPLALAELVAAAEAGAPKGEVVRVAVFGAVAEGALLARAEKAFACDVYICNGASEIGQTSFGRFDGATYVTGWCGRPLKKLGIRIGDGSASGESGRLYVRPPVEDRCEGYIGGPPAYDADGWFDTGDIARLLPDGALLIEGRADNLINLGGSKYAAERIEALVAQMPGVDICAATRIDRPGALAPELGIAVVAGSGFDLERTLAHMASKIRTTAKTRIVVCPKLPMLPTGKVDRSALAALFG